MLAVLAVLIVMLIITIILLLLRSQSEPLPNRHSAANSPSQCHDCEPNQNQVELQLHDQSTVDTQNTNQLGRSVSQTALGSGEERQDSGTPLL